MSRTALADVAGVEPALAGRTGFFSRLYAAITKSRQRSTDRYITRHQHLLDRLADRIEPAGTGRRPGVVATPRTRAKGDVAARYVGDRWCDTTERKLNDDLMAEYRGSFVPWTPRLPWSRPGRPTGTGSPPRPSADGMASLGVLQMLKQPSLSTTPCRDGATIELTGRHAEHWTVQWGRLSALLAVWAMRRGTRRTLGELDDRQLADVGLTRKQALLETAKPFWQP